MRSISDIQQESEITDQLLEMAYTQFPDHKARLVAGAFLRVSVAMVVQLAGEPRAETVIENALKQIFNERKPRLLQ